MNQWLTNSQSQIDGKGIIVEIDKAKFGHRQYHCERLVKG